MFMVIDHEDHNLIKTIAIKGNMSILWHVKEVSAVLYFMCLVNA